MFVRDVSTSLPWARIVSFVVGSLCASYYFHVVLAMKQLTSKALVLTAAATVHASDNASCASSGTADLNWYAPDSTMINSLTSVVNDSGIYGYIFNSSNTPASLPYSTYNWCSMPHVRAQEYIVPSADYELAYVEIIHRHHKRTPYASNTFPVEDVPWNCDDEYLYYYGAPTSDGLAAQIGWSVSVSPINPFPQQGFQNSSCQFPQITSGGLLDSRQHGADLKSVYIDKLNFLPSTFSATTVKFRVTNNQITSQVAGEVAIGLYPSLVDTQLPVIVQPVNLDTLEPQYPCSLATSLYSSYGIGSTNPAWQAHLNASGVLFNTLDTISGVNRSDNDWHDWFNHYFDNLSAKLCHDKPLPCDISNSSLCVNESIAEDVFRRGLYEYSFIYRDNNNSLTASTASFGLWVAELANNMRAAMSGGSPIKYRHNVAHDGSLSRLLSILQIDVMVWPGMGSEVVFELWKSKSSGCWTLRVLWKGQVLRSSNPSLGTMDMIPVDTFLSYMDGLVGVNGSKVKGLCSSS